MKLLPQSTAGVILFGPFVAISDGVTPVTNVAVPTALNVWKNGVNSTVNISTGAGHSWTHRADGFYELGLAGGDVGTCGILKIEMTAAATYCAVWDDYMVVPAAVYNALTGVANAVLPANALSWNGTLISEANPLANLVNADTPISGVKTQTDKIQFTSARLVVSGATTPPTAGTYALATNGVFYQIGGACLIGYGGGVWALVNGMAAWAGPSTLNQPAGTYTAGIGAEGNATVAALYTVAADSSQFLPANMAALAIDSAGHVTANNDLSALATAANQITLLNAVNAITNVTARSAPKVPAILLRPAAGYVDYPIDLYLYDGKGNLEDADGQAVTIAARAADGASLAGALVSATMTRHAAGWYRGTYHVTSADAQAAVYFDFAWTVSAAPMRDGGVASVQDIEVMATIAAAAASAASADGKLTAARLALMDGSAQADNIPTPPTVEQIAAGITIPTPPTPAAIADELERAGGPLATAAAGVAALSGGSGGVRDFFRMSDITTGARTAGVGVWIATDAAGADVIAGPMTTDASGLVWFELDPTADGETYWVHAQLGGRNFNGYPRAFTVGAEGFAWV